MNKTYINTLIEKAIPMDVENTGDPEIPCNSEGGCPKCGSGLYSIMNYCYHCGQKVKFPSSKNKDKVVVVTAKSCGLEDK